METFRIIHISDLHLCVRPNRRNFLKVWEDVRGDPQQLPMLTLRHLPRGQHIGFLPSSYSDEISELAAKFIYDLDEKFDALVVSGDIATIGNKQSIEASYAYVSTPYHRGYLGRALQPTLGGREDSIFLLPGNHDRYQNYFGEPGGKQFDVTFSKYWRASNGVTSRVLSKNGEQLFLVSGDFCLRSNEDASVVHRLGRGKAYEDVVDEMEAESANLQREFGSGVLVWVVHFPPAHWHDETLILIDRLLLEGAVMRARVKVLFAGHLHENRILRTDYGTPILCAGSLCSCEQDGNNWIHQVDLELQGNALKAVRKTDFSWSDDDQQFARPVVHDVTF